MATAAISPVEQYLRSDFEPDAEYVNGEVELRPMGELDHATWQQAIEKWFDQHTREWNLRVRCELRVQVTPTNFRVPDVVVWDRSHPREPVLTHPPLAVFEVMSPEDTFPRVMRKLRDYESMGIGGIFVVEPEGGSVHRFLEGSLQLSPQRLQLGSGPILIDWDAIAALRDE